MMVLHVWGVGWSVKFNMHNISNMSIAFIEQTMPTCSMHSIQHACTKANVLAQHANIHTQYADIHTSCKHNMSSCMHNMSYISMYLQYANMHVQYVIMHAQYIIVQAQHVNMHEQNANVHTQHANMHTQYTNIWYKHATCCYACMHQDFAQPKDRWAHMGISLHYTVGKDFWSCWEAKLAWKQM